MEPRQEDMDGLVGEASSAQPCRALTKVHARAVVAARDTDHENARVTRNNGRPPADPVPIRVGLHAYGRPGASPALLAPVAAGAADC